MHEETTERLIVSVEVLREQYERARNVHRQLIAQRRQIASEVRNLARYGCINGPSLLQSVDQRR